MTKSQTAFEGTLDRYFETSLQIHPLLATYSGLTTGEGRLGREGLTFEQREERRRRRTLTALDGINPQELTSDQQLDRLALRAQLLEEREDFARNRHGLEPDAPEAVLNILLHELQRGDDEPVRAARNIRSLLKQAPAYLDEAATLIQQPEVVWLRMMRETIDGSPSLFEAVREFLAKAEPPKKADSQLIDGTSRAFGRYASAVEAKPPAPSGSFALGAMALQRRVRDELGLDYTLGEIESLALVEAGRIGGLLAKECARFGKDRRAEEIVAEARANWNPGNDLLATYRSETDRVAKAFRAKRAVTFPGGQTLEVRPVPEFMRHMFPTAAYSSPGAFAKRQRGIFWVNDLSVTRKTEAEKLAERQQHFGLSLTAAHEAYPGHHLQFTTANQHPRRWRRLFAHAVFYEGWTLWCEQMMVDLRIDRSPWVRVQQLHDALWRVHRILVDLRLQTGRYTYEQGVRHMQRHLGFTKSRAEADVNWYTASPAVPMSYWLGRLENARLHRRLVEGRGWSLRRFNDWLLSFGTLPQGWIEKYGLD